MGDLCDDDDDGDGYTDAAEAAIGENTTNYCAIMRADLNGCGSAGFSDLLQIATWYNQAVPPTPERIKQKADNVINFNDLLAFAVEYNKVVSSCP